MVADPGRKSAKQRQQQRAAALKAVATNIGRGKDQEFDRLIYERLRLGIVSALAVNDTLTFSELKQLFLVTDGNLSAHARKLEQAGYVGCRKSFENRTPRSEYRLTAKGRRALERYLTHMEGLIEATRSG